MGVYNNWVPGLTQHGPPPGANDQGGQAANKRLFKVETVALARNIEWHKDNWRLTLTDELQPGEYTWEPDRTDEDDGIRFLRPKDYSRYGRGLWMKFI
jgi:hypothetical protein